MMFLDSKMQMLSTTPKSPPAQPDGPEKVLCVPTSLLHKCGYFEGYTNDIHAYKELFLAGAQSFQDRDLAETNEEMKQLIPYVILMLDSRVAVYRRSKRGGEERLHGKWSLGFGGHINPVDAELPVTTPSDFFTQAYCNGLARELMEELDATYGESTDMKIPLVGFINDDANAVGRVHLGVVHAWTLREGRVVPNSDEIRDMRWVKHDELAGIEFEPWSQICLDNIPWLGPVFDRERE